MEYSIDDLLKFLSLSNKKLKKLKHNIKNIRIERNKYKAKLKEIESYLDNTFYYFGRYDYPSDREHYMLEGKLAMKDELLKLLKE